MNARTSIVARAVLVGLVMVAGLTGLDACGGSSGASGATCGVGATRGPSESCCLAYGVDACGANLFCAAFDGRTQATCYPLKSRLALEECNADTQCASGACNLATSKCASLPGEACERATGCAELDPGNRVFGCAPPVAGGRAICDAIDLPRCGSVYCKATGGGVCAVPSAGVTVACESGWACQAQHDSELSICVPVGVTGKAPLYGPCTYDQDCGDGTYDGMCLASSHLCGYRECTSDATCTAGKSCLSCPIRGGRTLEACVSEAHVGLEGARCQ